MKKKQPRLSALVLLTEPIEKLLRAKKKRSSNLVVDDAINLLYWINKKMVSRSYNDSTHLTIVDRQTSIALGISERRAKKAKALLKEVGAIEFWKKTSSGGFWTNLWSISINYSRVVSVINGYYRLGGAAKYQSNDTQASFRFISEENNILIAIKDDTGSRSIFRKHRKVFEKQRLEAIERAKFIQASAVKKTAKARRLSHDFIDKYLETCDSSLIDF